MPYDDVRASRYDEAEADKFAQAASTVEALAGLHQAAEAEGGRAGPALELGIGTGRLALPLAARGIEVWGIDDSAAMVARLREKPGAERLRVVMGDFADVDQLVPGRYALVFVAYNTLFELPSQDDQVRCFSGVAAHLAPGGRFVVEAFVPDFTRLEQGVNAARVEPDRVQLVATRHDPVRQQTVSQNIVITEKGVELDPWTIRYASVPELDLMARLAGLRLRQRWGGWHREPFTAASSTHVSVYEHADPAPYAAGGGS